MLKLSLFDGDYVVRFRHGGFTHRNVFKYFTEASLHKVDAVEILPGNKREGEREKILYQQEPIYVAASFCHPKDHFTKKTGRKIALSRLLEWMTNNRFDLSEGERREIWELYFSKHRK